MAVSLSGFVRLNGRTPEERVNRAMLVLHTKQVVVEGVDWEQIKCLYLFGTKADEKRATDETRLKTGIYVDESETEVLVVDAADIHSFVNRCSERLERLTIGFMDVHKTDLCDLPENLKRLTLNGTNLSSLSDLKLPESLQGLYLNSTLITSLKGVTLPDSLEVLYLSQTPLASLEGVKLPDNLRGLDLSGTMLKQVSGIDLPSNLRRLYLSGTPLMKLKNLERLDNLQELFLSRTCLTSFVGITLPDKLHELHMNNVPIADLAGATLPEGLRKLYLNGTALDDLNGVQLPDGLRKLCLSRTPLKNLDGIKLPQSLQRLDLDRTLIRRLPDSLKSLTKLQVLNLAHMRLDELPDWLVDLHLPINRYLKKNSICLEATSVKGIDMSIFDQSQEAILQWFEERKQEKEANPLNEVKVVFLGDGGAGKSHTIARLLKDGRQTEDFPNISTPGIVITDKTYPIGDREVKVHYWDFGGQEILHSMHRMFLTQRTLYVVMVNVRDGNQDERARYWLHNLKSFADGAPVLLVLNQMDMNKNASINEKDLHKLYPGLTKVVELSTLTYSDEQFKSEFIDVLMDQIGKMDILEYPFIRSWSRLKEKLQNMEKNYIFGDVFREYCEESGVKGSDTVRRDLLNWFSDLGISFCYSGSASLEDYVVLRPDWITNAIYIVLFNRMEAVRNGLVDHETIYRMLSSEDMEEVRRTVASAKYKPFEVDYVLKVFRKFRLSFLVEDGVEFLPMLCDANTTSEAAVYENDPDALEFRMHYAYLPNNVIHRLMVERRRELDLKNVWLTGARFVYDKTGLSAVVKAEDKLIRIMVKRNGPDSIKPQLYLDALKADLERISQEMGLTMSKMEVVYKSGEITECFSYKTLLSYQKHGQESILSEELDEMIPLADILKQSDRPVDEAKTKLIHALTNACVKLQDNRVYWDSNLNEKQRKTIEDDRTTFIRDMLTSAKFICADQHFTGEAVGGHKAGELDVDIRLEPDTHWTALEALNLSGAELANWGKHLDKLLTNYNQSGRSFLFHVGYLTCEADKFSGICTKFWDHMRTYMPKGMAVLSAKEFPLGRQGHDAPANVRAMECVYDCGSPVTVYHFFVHMHP